MFPESFLVSFRLNYNKPSLLDQTVNPLLDQTVHQILDCLYCLHQKSCFLILLDGIQNITVIQIFWKLLFSVAGNYLAILVLYLPDCLKILMPGVQAHLDSPLPNVRRLGMIVAESVTHKLDSQNQPLQFEVRWEINTIIIYYPQSSKPTWVFFAI